MELGPRAEQPDENWLAARRAILDEIRAEGLPFDDIPSLLKDDAIANRLSAQAHERLAATGIDIDSLDLIEAIVDLINEPWSSDDSDETGGAGVREPRRPKPSSGSGSIELQPS